MGGTITSTLSRDQLASITDEIKKEYDQLIIDGKLSEDEIKQNLMVKYEKFVKETTNPDTQPTSNVNTPPLLTPTDTPTNILKKEIPSSNKGGGIKAIPKPKAAQATSERRKSFDTKNIGSNKNKGKPSTSSLHTLQSTPENSEGKNNEIESSSTVNTTTTLSSDAAVEKLTENLQHSQSEPILVHAVDSWDSVTEQPFCKICQMAFKSLAFLDRHVKYSDVHSKNLKLLNETTTDVLHVDKLQERMTQKEGVHYKLIYHGAKLFFKTKDNFIIDIFHHIIPHTIEVVSFCDVRAKEISRIYLDFNVLASIVKNEVNEKCKNEIAKHQKEKSQNPLDDILLDARRKAITSTILSHLQLNVSGEIRNVLFMKSGADDYTEDPVLKIPPDSLIPVSVARKRKTNMDDFNIAMKGLEADRQALKDAMTHAEKILSIVQDSVSKFARRSAIYASLNPIRKRWFLAVRRIISQNYVAHYTKLLIDLEKKKTPTPKARRARNSTIYSGKATRPKEV